VEIQIGRHWLIYHRQSQNFQEPSTQKVSAVDGRQQEVKVIVSVRRVAGAQSLTGRIPVYAIAQTVLGDKLKHRRLKAARRFRAQVSLRTRLDVSVVTLIEQEKYMLSWLAIKPT
jgi:hypothetical protein